MRVLMINDEFTISGSSTAFFRLAVHLRDEGHAVTVLPRNPTDGPVLHRYRDAGLPVETTVAVADFDVAVGSTICAAPLLLEVAPSLPTVWIVNEAEVALRLLVENPGWIPAFRSVDAVVFQMPFQKEVLASFTLGCDPAKFHVIPWGVEVDASALAADAVPPKARPLRVVQVGTIEPRKRPQDLILAVARGGLDVECAICGSFFHLAPEALAAVEADPARFRLLSGLPDAALLAWVASADVFCLASGSETQGLAAYEAALLARPLLLSDLRCYDGVFTHGRNCLRFPPGHLEMLAGSIRMLAASPALRSELGQAARSTASGFSHRRFFSRFDALLDDVVGAAGARRGR